MLRGFFERFRGQETAKKLFTDVYKIDYLATQEFAFVMMRGKATQELRNIRLVYSDLEHCLQDLFVTAERVVLNFKDTVKVEVVDNPIGTNDLKVIN